MNTELEALVKQLADLNKQHDTLEDNILDKISELPRYGCECNCDGLGFNRVHHGNHFNEIISECLECGGVKG